MRIAYGKRLCQPLLQELRDRVRVPTVYADGVRCRVPLILQDDARRSAADIVDFQVPELSDLVVDEAFDVGEGS